jgi:lipopolysaccharide/colanic/teichoic acid biosynthesis glycosyltransferase
MKLSWYRAGGKRLFDLALSSFGLALFAVPIALISLKILAGSGRPLLFRQPRIGLNGRRFVILKFRTMANGDKNVITPFGRLLRATAMDELPQLVNIFRGEMSFVGPRPIIPEELQDLDAVPNGKRRLTVRPGLAGVAQLNSDKTPTLAERVKWDCLYVDKCSFLLDLQIILISIWVTLTGRWEKTGPKHGIGVKS